MSEVARSAGRMGIGVFLSRILGLVREQVFAYFFGAGWVTDAFQIAFRIPNLLRDLFAEGAMSAALVPTFIETREKEGDERGWQLASRVLVWLFVVVSFLSLLGIFFADALVRLYAQKFLENPAQFDLAVRLTQMMMPFFPLVALAAGFMAILNACGVFFIPSFASALFNLISILTGLLLTWMYGKMGQEPIQGMAIGVVLGGLVQAFVQWPSLIRAGFRFRLDFETKDPALKRMLSRMIPGTLGLAATQIGILINSIYATQAGMGAVSWLNYAFRFMQFPIGIFGVSLSSATLPAVSRALSHGRREEAKIQIQKSTLQMLSLNFPAAIGLLFLSEPLIGALFERGAFDRADTRATAYCLMGYAIGLPAYSLVKLYVPILYALGRTRFAVISAVISVVVNAVANHFLIGSYGAMGLAVATTISSSLNAVLLAVVIFSSFRGVSGQFQDFWMGILKYLVGAIGMGFVLWGGRIFLENTSYFLQLLLLVPLGGLLFVAYTFVTKGKEFLEFLSVIKRRFR